MELKETIKEVRETTASKIKKPESSVPLSKTIKSPLKSVYHHQYLLHLPIHL